MIKYFQGKKDTDYKDSVYFMTGDYGYATNRIKPIMEFIKKNKIKKPVMISEGGVPTNNLFGEDLTAYSRPRFDNFLWYLVMKYPEIKLINYFNTHRPNENERYDISDYTYTKEPFIRAKNSGVYITEYNGEPEFIFKKFTDATKFRTKNTVNLYTYAYAEKKPNMAVTYRLNGNWYHIDERIPYICSLELNKLNIGENTITISTSGMEKTYKFIYDGQGGIQYIPDKVIEPEKEEEETKANDEPTAKEIIEEVVEEIPVEDEPGIKVKVNGTKIKFDVPPMIQNGRTLIPLRACAEALGAQVQWLEKLQTAIITCNATRIAMPIGKSEYEIDGKETPIDVPAQIIDGRTLVPVRAISEAFGADVKWEEETKTVYINN